MFAKNAQNNLLITRIYTMEIQIINGRRVYKGLITELPPNGLFVFGSNTEGRHSLGAAKTARGKFGAIYGRPSGIQGRSYGLVTKDLTKKIHPSISRGFIETQIRDLYATAIENSVVDFYVAYSGTGTNLNGYSNLEMAEMFSHTIIPENIIFEEEFSNLLKI